jgi:hypothetical protein
VIATQSTQMADSSLLTRTNRSPLPSLPRSPAALTTTVALGYPACNRPIGLLRCTNEGHAEPGRRAPRACNPAPRFKTDVTRGGMTGPGTTFNFRAGRACSRTFGSAFTAATRDAQTRAQIQN